MNSRAEIAHITAPEQGGKLLEREVDFVFKYFEAAELEARTTERYVLVALGVVYPYLAANVTIVDRVVWFVPTVVVLFAAARAVGMGWRQGQLLTYLSSVESKVMPGTGEGWAKWYKEQAPFVAVSALLFYAFLFVVTFVVALASPCLVPGK